MAFKKGLMILNHNSVFKINKKSITHDEVFCAGKNAY